MNVASLAEVPDDVRQVGLPALGVVQAIDDERILDENGGAFEQVVDPLQEQPGILPRPLLQFVGQVGADRRVKAKADCHRHRRHRQGHEQAEGPGDPAANAARKVIEFQNGLFGKDNVAAIVEASQIQEVALERIVLLGAERRIVVTQDAVMAGQAFQRVANGLPVSGFGLADGVRAKRWVRS